MILTNKFNTKYSLVPNSRGQRRGGWGGWRYQIANFWKKNPEDHLIIIQE